MSGLRNLCIACCHSLLFRYRCGVLVQWTTYPYAVFEITQQRYTTCALGSLLVEYALVPVQGTMQGTGGWALEKEVRPWQQAA